MMMPFLIAVLKEMQDTVLTITVDDLTTLFDNTLITKLRSTSLTTTFLVLGDILVQQSEEARNRDSKRAKENKKAQALREAEAMMEAESEMEVKGVTTARSPRILQSTLYGPQVGLSGPRIPSTSSIAQTPTKRKISETSFGTRSTETTPTKLVSAEANIQNLQDAIVRDVIVGLYGTGVPIKWARNRDGMGIKYQAFLHPSMCH